MVTDRRAIIEPALAAHAALVHAKAEARMDALIAEHGVDNEWLDGIIEDDAVLRELREEKLAFLVRIAVPLEDYMGFVLAGYTRVH